MRWFAFGLVAAIVGCSAERPEDKPTEGATKPKPADVASISGIRWGERTADNTGPLYVQATDGKETLVAEDATDSTIGADRQTVYYTFFDGSTKGEGLKSYSLATGKGELVFAYDREIFSVLEVTSNSGKRAVIANAMDLESETPEVIVADPARGRVFWLKMAHFAALDQGIASFSVYNRAQIKGVPYGAWPKPDKTESLDLDVLLRREASREVPQ
jgi:hypothetical protein